MKITDQFTFIDGKFARNRIGMPPMDTSMSDDGYVNDFHIQHYGSRAYGGVGFIIVESSAVMANGRIKPHSLGIWKDEHLPNLTRLSKIIKQGGALAGIQLNHAGAKSEIFDLPRFGATMAYDYLDQSNFTLITKTEISEVEDAFVKAAWRAKKANFDFVEIHAAHGYLLSQLISEELNQVIKSNDILKRASLVINIVERIKQEVKIPIGIRFSINDDHASIKQVKKFAPLIKKLEPNINYFNISSGETTHRVSNLGEIMKQLGTPIFRIPLAKEVKKITNKPLFIAGNVTKIEHVKEILANNIPGVLVGREMIFNPNFVINQLLSWTEIDQKLYGWNQNNWFQPNNYAKLKAKIEKANKISN